MVDLNYNFECDWFVELSDNKLSDNKLSDNKLSANNLASKLVGDMSFFKAITIEEIVIFMIKSIIPSAQMLIKPAFHIVVSVVSVVRKTTDTAIWKPSPQPLNTTETTDTTICTR